MTTQARPLFASERLRHAVIALGILLVLGMVRLLYPIDMTIWSIQAKLIDRPLASDVIYVDLKPVGETDAALASSQNRQVLATIRAFERSDVDLIAINVPLRRSDTREIDQALRAELIENSDRIVLTRDDGARFPSSSEDTPSDSFFEIGLPVLNNHLSTDFLDQLWVLEPRARAVVAERPMLWSRLTATDKPSFEALAPDYTLRIEDVRQFEIQQILETGSSNLRVPEWSKIVVGSQRNIRVVKEGWIPSGIVHILAAATYDQGRGAIIPWYAVVFVIFPLLLVCVLSRASSGRRRKGYGVLTITILFGIGATAAFGVHAEFADGMALLAIYAGFRAFARYKRRHLLIEPRSKLPNFVALDRDLGGDEMAPHLVIVVAKVARLDSVFTTLRPSEQERYLRQIADRLSFGQSDSTIYYDGGKYFAFGLRAAQFEDLEGHLRGLRAIATQSVEVGSNLFDVSMTFGVDQDPSRTVSNRLSSAIVGADRAREAYRPVFMIADLESGKEDWDHSLQTRLEHALSHDRIDIALQPQFDLESGQIVGAEALARWFDEEQGQIPPERFIGQCERVGRLDELTERIMSKTLDSIEAMRMDGKPIDVSINISAIQLADGNIADLIERQIVPRAIDPRGVTIELTETARIENFAVARRTIERIKELGLRFAIDDFGVRSANLQTIYELPFDEIKIDRLFVGNLRQSTKARAITKSLISLARESGMVSIAEGIEDNFTLEMLKELGCERAQGYFLSRPMSPKGLIKLLKENNEMAGDRRYLG